MIVSTLEMQAAERAADRERERQYRASGARIDAEFRVMHGRFYGDTSAQDRNWIARHEAQTVGSAA